MSNIEAKKDGAPELGLVPGSADFCSECGIQGRHVRVRNFDTEDADVWECDNPRCKNFGFLWHTPREKDELGKMRCALIALVEAEKASRDNFDGKSIERIEQAMQRAERVLFPERWKKGWGGIEYLQNACDEARAKPVASGALFDGPAKDSRK